MIGGIEIGAAGTGIYSGYILSAGDDFQTLDLVSSSNPTGKYFTTRTYQGSGGCRAPASGPLAVMYDVSPDHTGWRDANRGVPIPSLVNSHQIVLGEGTGALRLVAIRQSDTEQVLLSTGVSGQIERSAMISGVGAFWWDSPAIIEFRARLPTGPHGQHLDMWGLSSEPPNGPGFSGNEYGWECGNSKTGAYQNSWHAGSLTNTETDIANYREGNFHTFTVVLSTTDYKYYIDGALVKTASIDPSGNGAKADHMLITHHVLNQIYQSQTYTPSEWGLDVLPTGIEIDIEWVRIWRLASGTHYAPLSTVPDVQVTAGGALNVALPSQATLWGATGLTEYVTCVQNEVEEPGSSNTTSYAQFPPSITYNVATRTLSGTMPSESGALYVIIAVKGDGNTCVPARFRICAAPIYKGIGTYSWAKGVAVSQDIYTEWDVGRLFQCGANPKGLVVTGLPAGLLFSPSTGLIWGIPMSSGSGSLSLSCTNSAGQTTYQTNTYITLDPGVGAVAPVLTGNPVLVGSWDFDQVASINSTSGSIDSIMGVDGTVVALTGTGPTRPVLSTRTAGGMKGIADFTSSMSHTLSAPSNFGLGTGGCAIVAIAEPKTLSLNSTLFEISQSSAISTVNRHALGSGAGVIGWGMRKCGSSGGNQDANQGLAYTLAPTLLIGGSKAGTAGSTINVNGVAATITSAGAAPNAVGLNLTTLGCRSVSGVLGNFFNGYVWRILLYGQTLTDTNREEIAVWANTHYGTLNNP